MTRWLDCFCDETSLDNRACFDDYSGGVMDSLDAPNLDNRSNVDD